MDTVICANKVMDLMKSKGVKGFIFKLDFHKAFDSIS
jgi:hypothetical protein